MGGINKSLKNVTHGIYDGAEGTKTHVKNPRQMNTDEEGGFKALSPARPEDNFPNFPKNHCKFFFPIKLSSIFVTMCRQWINTALVSLNIIFISDV